MYANLRFAFVSQRVHDLGAGHEHRDHCGEKQHLAAKPRKLIEIMLATFRAAQRERVNDGAGLEPIFDEEQTTQFLHHHDVIRLSIGVNHACDPNADTANIVPMADLEDCRALTIC
jgi:hypothetical protein